MTDGFNIEVPLTQRPSYDILTPAIRERSDLMKEFDRLVSEYAAGGPWQRFYFQVVQNDSRLQSALLAGQSLDQFQRQIQAASKIIDEYFPSLLPNSKVSLFVICRFLAFQAISLEAFQKLLEIAKQSETKHKSPMFLLNSVETIVAVIKSA